MGVREYIGARYVPIFGRKDEETIAWDNSEPYEPLTVVLYQGNSYTSRQYVPAGIDITNTEYWANTGNYNAQIEQYRQEVANLDDRYDDILSIIERAEIVQNFSDIYKTTSEYVIVLDNSGSTYGVKNYIIYEETEATLDTVARENGTYMFPSPINYNETPISTPVTEMFNCIASYLGQNLVYGSEETLFSPTAGNQIDCSSFTEACMLGITYSQSRYSRGSVNTNLFSKYATDNMNKDAGTWGYITSWKLADWFLQRREFYKISSRDDIYKLNPGDILFGSTPNHPEYADRIYGIDHCMIVLQVFKDDGAILIAQGGSTPTGVTIQNFNSSVCKITLANFISNAGSYFVGFARPNYGVGQVEGTNITQGLLNMGEVTISPGDTDTNLVEMRLTKPLEQGKMYYLVCTGKLPVYDVDGGWLALTVRSPFTNIARLYHLSFYNGKCIFPFAVTSDFDYQNVILRVLTSNITATQQYEITSCAIYEGFCPLDDGYEDMQIVQNENVTFGFWQSYSYFDNEGKPHLQLQFEFSDDTPLAASHEVVIGRIQNMPPYALNPVVFATVGRSASCICTINASNGDIYIYNSTAAQLKAGNRIRIIS